MNTTHLKAYAPKARRDFITAVTKQAQKYGVTKSTIHPVEINGDVCVVNGKPFPASLAPRINKLGEKVKSNGFEQTMEQVAYSWFNRLMAIRYMELHDYLGHGRRVLSHPEHPTGFQILEECTDISYGEGGQLPHLSHSEVVALKLDGTQDEALYRKLLLAQCHALHQAMPFLFEKIDDETELLLPENLTKTDSLIHDLVTDIAEEDWDNIEVIGWLYQFYISEKKDEVIGKVVKSEDIPAATQLFTPNWIVKYMVQNSLGAQWLATYPDSPLKAQMEYYIEPAEQTDEVNAQLKAITPESLNPEELTLIDPASGSGHILVEAYDLFKAIYLERGYRPRDIAQLILEKNLFGLDIDQRAAQMSGFALMMKGRADDRRLFDRGIKLNVMALQDSAGFDTDSVVSCINLDEYGLTAENLTELKSLFEHATTFGSLIQVPEGLAEKLPALKQLSEATSQDLFVSALKRLEPLVQQAELLATQYDAVVANPPYMGSKGMNPLVKAFAKNHFFDAKNDLFACFMERAYTLACATGYNAMVTMQSWMFLSSFESMRTNMMAKKTIASMAHLGARAFGSISGEVVQTTACVLKNSHVDDYKPTFFRLLDGNEEEKRTSLIAGDNRFDQTAQDEFNKIPGSPIAYWMTDNFLKVFTKNPPLKDHCYAGFGIKTGNNDHFIRHWHETSISNIGFKATPKSKFSETWYPCASGGEFRRWFGNRSLVVNYQGKGKEIEKHARNHGNSYGFNGQRYYFRQSIIWPKLTSSANSFRLTPADSVFDGVGLSAFFESDEEFYGVLSALNTRPYQDMIDAVAPTLSLTSGDFLKLPYPTEYLEGIARENAKLLVELAKSDWNSYERSWDFQSLPLLTTSSKCVFW